MKQTIQADSNCIDVGCHKGEILDGIIRLAPQGHHFGFEPIPSLYERLKSRYTNKATIYPYALSDASGKSTFQFVKNAPAYSGLQKRKYEIEPDIEEINVELKPLDEVIPADEKIDFIKIDVEGGEFGVLKGAKEILKKNMPTIIFECGMGASEYYGTNPGELYDFLATEIGLKVSLLKSFLDKGTSLSRDEFESHFNENKEYYFVAHK
ncbi:MAG: FkbM family methyltransferase [Crocinitomicaceae bacterium]|nr:FkbM family methyltransferase [Crocinitomicaceae bacterium]